MTLMPVFLDIDVYVDNDTCPTPPNGCTSSFVTYQLKAFKVGAFATFSYFSSSQTSGSVVTDQRKLKGVVPSNNF